MKTIEIISPDGVKYQVSAPDNATNDEIQSYIDENVIKKAKEAKQIKASEIPKEPEISPLSTFASSLSPIGIASAAYGAKEAIPKLLEGNYSGALDTYRTQRDFGRAGLEESQKQNPRSALLGQLTPALVTAGMGVPTSIPIIAGMGGIQSAIDSKADLTKLNESEQRRRLGLDVGTGLAVGGLFGGLGSYAPKSTGAAAIGALGGQLVDPSGAGALVGGAVGLGARAGMSPTLRGYLAKKAGALLNVGEDISDGYLKNSEKINLQRPKEEIYDEILNYVDTKRDRVLQAKENLSSAKKELSYLKNRLQFANDSEKAQLNLEIKYLKQQISGHREQVIAESKGIPKPIDYAEQAVSSVDALQTRVNDLSKMSYDVLEKENVQLPIKRLILIGEKIKRDQGIGVDKSILTDADKKGADAIDRQLKTLWELLEANRGTVATGPDVPRNSEMLSGSDLKKILQDLGTQIDYSAGAGEYTGNANRMLTKLRAALNEELKKQSPEYRKIMELDLSPLTSLLSESSSLFKNNNKALSTMSNITSPANRAKREVLNRLGKETGFDFENLLKKHEETQKFLSDETQIQSLLSKMDESSALAKAESRLEEINQPGFTKNKMRSDVITSEENQALQDAVAELQSAQKELKPYKSLKPESLESTLNAATMERISPSRTIRAVGDALGKDYGQELENLRIKQALATGKPQGARNAMIGAGIGAGIGASVAGGAGSAVGGAVGAGFGGMVDKYAGPMTKKILDGELVLRRLQNSPVAQKYIPVIQGALDRGSFATTYYLLSQSHPDFQKAMSEDERK